MHVYVHGRGWKGKAERERERETDFSRYQIYYRRSRIVKCIIKMKFFIVSSLVSVSANHRDHYFYSMLLGGARATDEKHSQPVATMTHGTRVKTIMCPITV